MKKVVVFTGAGVSAESGIKTFRDHDGLWENHSIYDVATPEAWHKNPELVQKFYNERRKQLLTCEPNAAHFAIAELEKYFDVKVITQNVDDLHERAGSSHVIHLHGELRKACSSLNKNLVYDIEGWEIKMGEKCEKGSQLRPFIVWFGEEVPKMMEAYAVLEETEIFIVVGTSLNVYPAAGLVDLCPPETTIYLIDPNANDIFARREIIRYNANAGQAMPLLLEELIKKHIKP
jgi:NAD-dependent deacetylase